MLFIAILMIVVNTIWMDEELSAAGTPDDE